MSGRLLARAAERLVGAPFRLHGRDPATGLDCIGVLAAALGELGIQAQLPDCYTLRTVDASSADGDAEACGLSRAPLPIRPGDVVLVRIGNCQHHLLLAIGPERFVHAHAGLRRVVTHDGPLPWPLLGLWRLPQTSET